MMMIKELTNYDDDFIPFIKNTYNHINAHFPFTILLWWLFLLLILLLCYILMSDTKHSSHLNNAFYWISSMCNFIIHS